MFFMHEKMVMNSYTLCNNVPIYLYNDVKDIVVEISKHHKQVDE